MALRLRRLLPLLALLLLSTTRAQGQVVLSDRSANGSLAVAWNGTGTAPANSVVQVSLPSQGSAAVQITGTFSATLSFEALIDQKNATWLAIKGTPFAGGTTVSAAAATGAWVFPLGGVKVFRVRCSAYTSGTALVGVVASSAINTGTIAGSSGGGGTATSVSAADEAAFTPGTDPFNPIGGLFNDSAAALTSGQQGITRLTPNRAQHVNLRNNAGTEIGTSTTPVRVDPTGTTPQPVSGTVAATQSGTWTVQPGNTANTTAWKVDGSAVTQPVSATALPLPAGAATETTLAAQSAKFAAGAAAADGFANPTTTQIEMFPFVWNGTTWDRVKDMAAAQGQTTFTGVPAMAPFYLDTTGTPSVRRGVTAASITGSVTGTQIPASANALWDASVFRPQLSDTSGRAQVVGAAAAGAVPAGNPLLLGAVDPAGGTTLNNLQVQSAATPNLRVGLFSGATGPVNITTSAIDGDFNNSPSLMARGFSYDYNGGATSAAWDRHRNNVDATLLASAARTTTAQGTSSDTLTYNGHSVIVTLDVTTTTSTVSLTPEIDYKDPASGKYIPLLTGTTVAAAGTTTYAVNPNFSSATGTTYPYTKVAQADIGRIFRVVITHGNANSQTYSVGVTVMN